MNSISNLNSLSASSRAAALLSATGDSTAAPFMDLVDQLIAQGLPKSSVPSQAALQAQQRIADFRRKLALLTGMLEQAQIAMDAQKPLPGGLPSPESGEYFFVRSELARVGLPGAVNDVV